MTGCKTGRVRYRTEVEAQKALTDIRKRPVRERTPNRTYPCPFCNGHHLTSSGDQRPGRPGTIKLAEQFKKYINEEGTDTQAADACLPDGDNA